MQAHTLLSLPETERYQRQLSLAGVGKQGQLKLKQASVLVVGAGGLGCPALNYLAAAGIGTLGIVEDDVVSLSNLQRQTLYTAQDVGQPKLVVAAQRLQQQNPHLVVHPYPTRLSAELALHIFSLYDIIVDATDNFATRYLINDVALVVDKPVVTASVQEFEGQLTVLNGPLAGGKRGPNYRDLFAEPPLPGSAPSCVDAGVLGVLPGILGCLQANEVLKLVLGLGEPLIGKLLTFNCLTMQTRLIQFESADLHPQPWTAARVLGTIYDEACEVPLQQLTAADYRCWQQEGRPHLLVDVRTQAEYAMDNLGGILTPLAQLELAPPSLAKDVPLVVHCHIGQRSQRAAQLLQQRYGYPSVYNLKGGLVAYRASEAS